MQFIYITLFWNNAEFDFFNGVFSSVLQVLLRILELCS